MSNFLYPLSFWKKVPVWIRYWLFIKIYGTLSELISGTDLTLTNSIKNRPIIFDKIKGQTSQDGEPRPETAISIKNVTGNANILLQNKNLFDWNKATIGKDIYSSGTIISSANGATSDYIDIHSFSKFTISGNVINNVNICWFDKEKNVVGNGGNGWTASTFVNGRTFTVPNNVYYYRFCLSKKATNIMVEGGDTKTDYIEHAEQNLPFTFGEGQFLADNEELQENGIYKKWKEVTFSGTTVTLADAKTNGAYYCNKKASGNLVGQTLTFDEEVTDAVIQYELAEPTTIAYNSTQQEQYNSIKNARSYDDITYISSTSDEQPFILDLQYYMKGGENQ